MARLADGLDEATKDFVCVRIIQMRGVDTSIFNFDFDLSWAGFFMNADMTVYGRYGTRRDQGDSQFTTAGLKEALSRALEIHKGYPANRASLAPKNVKAPVPAKEPENMPGLKGMFQTPDIPKGCIHCHHVWRGIRRSVMAAKKPLPDSLLWVYPMPDAVGMTIDPADGARVSAVAAGSPAAKAGVLADDVVATVGGAPLVSIADFQFALQNAPDHGALKIEVRRGTEKKAMTLTLPAGWRKDADFSWRSSTGDIRIGMQLQPLSDDERKSAGLKSGGIRVKAAWPKGPAGMAGFQPGDILTAVNGQPVPEQETDFVAMIRQKYLPGQKLKIALVRGGRRQELEMNVP